MRTIGPPRKVRPKAHGKAMIIFTFTDTAIFCFMAFLSPFVKAATRVGINDDAMADAIAIGTFTRSLYLVLYTPYKVETLSPAASFENIMLSITPLS